MRNRPNPARAPSMETFVSPIALRKRLTSGHF
jgi:hypothetical protein